MPYLGEISALCCSLLWSLSAIAWSNAGRRVGSQVSSAVRLILAMLMLIAIHWAIYKSPFPLGGSRHGFILLALSGVVGLGLGDLCFFNALKLVGPRIGMMLATISPAFTAVLAYFLPPHEALSGVAILGMIMTMAGVIWVILEKPAEDAWKVPPGMFRRGVMMGLLGATLFSVGYLFTRQALDPKAGMGWDPFPAVLVRVVAALAVTLFIVTFSGNLTGVRRVFSDWTTLKIITAGTIVGPVLGIWMSLIAFTHSDAGVATALITTGPLFMIPIVYFSHGEKTSLRGIIGAIVAIAGVVLLVLRRELG